MNPLRPAAAVAALVTALLLQAVVLGPLTAPAAVSLPAVLVAAVGLYSGPSAGMTFGFVAGLTADLASDHPLGALALVWTLLGLAAARVGAAPAARREHRRTAVLAGGLATGAVLAAAVVLTVLGVPGQAPAAVRWLPLELPVHLLLALALTPLVSVFLHAAALAPRVAPGPEAAAAGRRRALGTGTAGDLAAQVRRG